MSRTAAQMKLTQDVAAALAQPTDPSKKFAAKMKAKNTTKRGSVSFLNKYSKAGASSSAAPTIVHDPSNKPIGVSKSQMAAKGKSRRGSIGFLDKYAHKASPSKSTNIASADFDPTAMLCKMKLRSSSKVLVPPAEPPAMMKRASSKKAAAPAMAKRGSSRKSVAMEEEEEGEEEEEYESEEEEGSYESGSEDDFRRCQSSFPMGARVNPGGAPAMMKRNSSRNAKEQVHMRSVQYSDRVQRARQDNVAKMRAS